MASHSEKHQYEIVTGPLLPLQAADALIHTRETIINVAVKHGLKATFAPRVYMSSPGSAAHTHISVHSLNGPQKPVDALSAVESSFLAGVLKHLPAMTAVTLPTPASYKRVMDGVSHFTDMEHRIVIYTHLSGSFWRHFCLLGDGEPGGSCQIDQRQVSRLA